jgi:hypothetical protein
MADASTENLKLKKFRSPPYPMFDLAKAVERAKDIYSKAQQHPVGVNVVSDAWGMKSSDGKVWRAAAALIQYGLMQDSGTGQTRKFQISDSAKRIIVDNDPNSQRRKEAIKTAALSPMIHKELWGKYKSMHGLADAVILNYLMLDRAEAGESPYSDAAAAEVLNTYRATLAYAGLTDSDMVPQSSGVKSSDGEAGGGLRSLNKINVGDLVKWTSGGVNQFDARKVSWISEDGAHLRVIGSTTGIPMNEIEKVKMSAPSAPAHVPESTYGGSEVPSARKGEPGGGKIANISTSVVGGRLQLTADVSADEINALKDMLTKYQEILKLMH